MYFYLEKTEDARTSTQFNGCWISEKYIEKKDEPHTVIKAPKILMTTEQNEIQRFGLLAFVRYTESARQGHWHI